MSAAYVRENYPSVASLKVGDRLTVDGKPGVLVSFPNQYLGVRFDGEKRTSRCHPTWRVAAVRERCETACNCCEIPAPVPVAAPDEEGRRE